MAAALLYRAIGNRLTCVYVDHGFMRAGESDQVVDVFTRVSRWSWCMWTRPSVSSAISRA